MLVIRIQIEEVRLRLNLDVTVASDSPAASDSRAAPAPIESFTDMVFNLSVIFVFLLGDYELLLQMCIKL